MQQRKRKSIYVIQNVECNDICLIQCVCMICGNIYQCYIRNEAQSMSLLFIYTIYIKQNEGLLCLYFPPFHPGTGTVHHKETVPVFFQKFSFQIHLICQLLIPHICLQ